MAKVDAPNRELLLEYAIADYGVFHVDPDELNDRILTHGIGCHYKRALICPCLRIETGQPRAGCPACRGLGMLYPEGLEEDLTVLMVNRYPKRNVAIPVGELITGACVITFPLGIVPGRGDMVLPNGETHTVQQVVRRAEHQVEGAIVRARATAPDHLAPKVPVGGDRLLYPDVSEVEDLYWLDDGSTVRRGENGRDFDLVAGAITWRTGKGPEAGKAYSVRYAAPAAYVVFPAEPVTRAEADNFYPYRAEAMRLDRWGRPDLRG